MGKGSAANKHSTDLPCEHCGQYHSLMSCPRIAAIEYYPTGNIKRVEYVQPVSSSPRINLEFKPETAVLRVDQCGNG